MVKVFDKLISTEEGAMGVAGQEEFQISSDIDEIENPNQEGVINQISQNLCCQGFRSVKNNVKCKNKIDGEFCLMASCTGLLCTRSGNKNWKRLKQKVSLTFPSNSSVQCSPGELLTTAAFSRNLSRVVKRIFPFKTKMKRNISSDFWIDTNTIWFVKCTENLNIQRVSTQGHAVFICIHSSAWMLLHLN